MILDTSSLRHEGLIMLVAQVYLVGYEVTPVGVIAQAAPVAERLMKSKCRRGRSRGRARSGCRSGRCIRTGWNRDGNAMVHDALHLRRQESKRSTAGSQAYSASGTEDHGNGCSNPDNQETSLRLVRHTHHPAAIGFCLVLSSLRISAQIFRPIGKWPTGWAVRPSAPNQA